MKRLTFNCQIVSTKLTSYEGTNTTGAVKQAMGLTADITGRRVIIVEDIVDTGYTLNTVMKILNEYKPASLEIVTLLDKPTMRKVSDLSLKYIGFTIPAEFVVGFGLDYDELYRNLGYVGVLKKSVYEKK